MHRSDRPCPADHTTIPSDTPKHTSGEAFIPGDSPYVGQAVLGEPVRRTNVLFANRRDQ